MLWWDTVSLYYWRYSKGDEGGFLCHILSYFSFSIMLYKWFVDTFHIYMKILQGIGKLHKLRPLNTFKYYVFLWYIFLSVAFLSTVFSIICHYYHYFTYEHTSCICFSNVRKRFTYDFEVSLDRPIIGFLGICLPMVNITLLRILYGPAKRRHALSITFRFFFRTCYYAAMMRCMIITTGRSETLPWCRRRLLFDFGAISPVLRCLLISSADLALHHAFSLYRTLLFSLFLASRPDIIIVSIGRRRCYMEWRVQ